MSERNYDFRKRHWEYHKIDRRDPGRKPESGEILLTEDWKIGFAPSCGPIAEIAANDFQDYLRKSMGVSLPLTRTDGPGPFGSKSPPRSQRASPST